MLQKVVAQARVELATPAFSVARRGEGFRVLVAPAMQGAARDCARTHRLRPHGPVRPPPRQGAPPPSMAWTDPRVHKRFSERDLHLGAVESMTARETGLSRYAAGPRRSRGDRHRAQMSSGSTITSSIPSPQERWRGPLPLTRLCSFARCPRADRREHAPGLPGHRGARPRDPTGPACDPGTPRGRSRPSRSCSSPSR